MWGEKTVDGHTATGVLRSTSVLDEDGRNEPAFYDVPARSHVAELRQPLGVDVWSAAVLGIPQPRSAEYAGHQNGGVNTSTETGSARSAHSQPLRDTVRERLRQGIADGRWAPGDRLVERDLAEEFDVSRVPVREALQMLEREGFVQLLPRRGAVVCKLTPEVVSDLFDIRQALEVLATRRAAERIDDDGLARLRAVMEDGQRALEADDHAWSGTANTAFHETILDLADSEPLRDLLEPLSGRLKWLFRQTRDYPRVQAEHVQLFNALAARDAELAGAVALAHVRASRHMVLDVALDAYSSTAEGPDAIRLAQPSDGGPPDDESV